MTAWAARVYRSYLAFRPFSDSEAWAIFRLAAIAEAVSWGLLIIGIACKRLPVGWNEIPVGLAGRIHGTIFLLYIVAVLLLSPSLRWPWWRILIAGALANPPFGSLLYEQWTARERRHQEFRQLQGIVGYRLAITA